jgi:hypothetical protein
MEQLDMGNRQPAAINSLARGPNAMKGIKKFGKKLRILGISVNNPATTGSPNHSEPG